MKKELLAIPIAVVMCCSIALAEAPARNHITVESKTVCTNESGVDIHILLENAVDIRHVGIPLVIRSVEGGAFITKIRQSWRDRLPAVKGAPLGEYMITGLYTEQNCECASTKQIGFGTELARDTLEHAIEKSPLGLVFTRLRMVGANLPAGKDSTGSAVMTVAIGSKPGVFEIDSTCVCPSNKLMYVEQVTPPRGLFPTFTKGVITVRDCKASTGK